MSAAPIAIDRKALTAGGILASVDRYRGHSSELRLSVRVEESRRRYDLREWYADGRGEWRPGRLGMSGLSGSEIRSLLRLLQSVVVILPRRGGLRGRR